MLLKLLAKYPPRICLILWIKVIINGSHLKQRQHDVSNEEWEERNENARDNVEVNVVTTA